MSNAPIGIIDSGLGGLTIFKEIQKQLPNESLRYVGDTANVPYGPRPTNEIYQLSHALIANLVGQGVKAVVIACNTISVNCIHLLRADFPTLPIVGTAPAIKTAASVSTNRKIGILSTVATANSPYQADLISQFAADCEVLNLGTNELVPRIERGAFETDLPGVLVEVLEPFKSADIDALVLGCSHFPILRNQMQAILGDGVTILDSGAAIARQLGRVLDQNGISALLDATGHSEFITTAPSPVLPQMLERLGIQAAVAV
jgi:glutamate racemase